MQCLNLNPTREFEWIDPKDCDLNKYNKNG